MSRRVVGYRDGKPQYRDEGPAVARLKGYGGSQLGWFSGTVVAVVPRHGEPTLPHRADRQLREREPQE